MNIEKRLRDALGAERAAASGAEPTQSKWESVRQRANASRARRRAQQLVVVGLSAAAVVAVIVGVMLGSDRGSNQGLIDVPPVGGGEGPAFIVGSEDKRLVVRSAADGAVVRELVAGDELAEAEASFVRVSPDGLHVYFMRRGTYRCPEGPEATESFEVVRVAISGGPVEHVAWSGPSAFALSDQHVFFRSAESVCGGRSDLVRLNLEYRDPDPAAWDDEPSARNLILADDPTDPIVTPFFANAAGDRLIAFEPGGEYFLLEVHGDGSTSIHPVTFPASMTGARSVYGFIGDDVLGTHHGVDGTLHVASFDPLDGSDEVPMFETNGASVVDVDRSGANVLLAEGGSDQPSTYRRWSRERGIVPIGEIPAGHHAWARGPLAAPEHFVAVTPEGELQVREIVSGEVVRTVRSGIDISDGTPQLAPTPDGRFIYIDGQGRNSVCSEGRGDVQREIVRIRTSDGGVGDVAVASSPETVARGAEPAVSPDGSKLAYVTDVREGSTTECGRNTVLVVRDLTTGDERSWDSEHEELQYVVTSPRWSPDGNSVSFTLLGDESAHGVLDLSKPQSSELPLFDMMTFEASAHLGGFLDQDELLGFETPQDATEIVTYDLPTPPAAGSAPTAERVEAARRRFIVSQPGVHGPVSLEAVRGEHILYALHDPSTERDEPNAVFRYSLGDVQTRMVADDVLSVAWLPVLPSDDRSSAEPVEPGEAPRSVVMAMSDGRIAELELESGVVRTIAEREPNPIDSEQIVLSPDGGFVYFEQVTAVEDGGCEGSGLSPVRTYRVAREGGTPELVADGRWPALSRDGRLLAYVDFPRCEQPGEIVVRDIASGEEQRLTSADAPVVGPLSFTDDSKHLIAGSIRDGSMRFIYFPFEDDSEVRPTLEIDNSELGTTLTGHYVPGGQRFVSLVGGNGGYALREVDIRAEHRADPVTTGARTINHADLTDVLEFDIDVSGRNYVFLIGNAQSSARQLWIWRDGDRSPIRRIDGDHAVTAVAW